MSLHARLAELYAELAETHRRLADEAGEQYVDQHSSPLGARRHCRLVRSGVLEGFRVGRRILVRRRDLDAYLGKHRVRPTDPTEPSETDAPDDFTEQLFLKIGGGRAA